MLKKSSSFVLALNRSSTGTQPPHHSAARTNVVLLIRRTVRPRGYDCDLFFAADCPRNGASWRAGVGRVITVVFLSILRECSSVVPHVETIEILARQHSFLQAASVPTRGFLTDGIFITI